MPAPNTRCQPPLGIAPLLWLIFVLHLLTQIVAKDSSCKLAPSTDFFSSDKMSCMLDPLENTVACQGTSFGAGLHAQGCKNWTLIPNLAAAGLCMGKDYACAITAPGQSFDLGSGIVCWTATAFPLPLIVMNATTTVAQPLALQCSGSLSNARLFSLDNATNIQVYSQIMTNSTATVWSSLTSASAPIDDPYVRMAQIPRDTTGTFMCAILLSQRVGCFAVSPVPMTPSNLTIHVAMSAYGVADLALTCESRLGSCDACFISRLAAAWVRCTAWTAASFGVQPGPAPVLLRNVWGVKRVRFLSTGTPSSLAVIAGEENSLFVTETYDRLSAVDFLFGDELFSINSNLTFYTFRNRQGFLDIDQKSLGIPMLRNTLRWGVLSVDGGCFLSTTGDVTCPSSLFQNEASLICTRVNTNGEQFPIESNFSSTLLDLNGSVCTAMLNSYRSFFQTFAHNQTASQTTVSLGSSQRSKQNCACATYAVKTNDISLQIGKPLNLTQASAPAATVEATVVKGCELEFIRNCQTHGSIENLHFQQLQQLECPSAPSSCFRWMYPFSKQPLFCTTIFPSESLVGLRDIPDDRWESAGGVERCVSQESVALGGSLGSVFALLSVWTFRLGLNDKLVWITCSICLAMGIGLLIGYQMDLHGPMDCFYQSCMEAQEQRLSALFGAGIGLLLYAFTAFALSITIHYVTELSVLSVADGAIVKMSVWKLSRKGANPVILSWRWDIASGDQFRTSETLKRCCERAKTLEKNFIVVDVVTLDQDAVSAAKVKFFVELYATFPVIVAMWDEESKVAYRSRFWCQVEEVKYARNHHVYTLDSTLPVPHLENQATDIVKILCSTSCTATMNVDRVVVFLLTIPFNQQLLRGCHREIQAIRSTHGRSLPIEVSTCLVRIAYPLSMMVNSRFYERDSPKAWSVVWLFSMLMPFQLTWCLSTRVSKPLADLPRATKARMAFVGLLFGVVCIAVNACLYVLAVRAIVDGTRLRDNFGYQFGDYVTTHGGIFNGNGDGIVTMNMGQYAFELLGTEVHGTPTASWAPNAVLFVCGAFIWTFFLRMLSVFLYGKFVLQPELQRVAQNHADGQLSPAKLKVVVKAVHSTEDPADV